MTEEPQGNAAVAGQLERGVRPAAEACPTCGSDCNERDELIKAEREIERLRAALAKANEQAEHFERQWYLRGDAIEAAIPAMRAYARENPRHGYKGATQDPNGVHAWLARNDGPHVRAKLPAEEADDRPRRDDGNARPERPGIGCRSGSA
jgi:hypothetical protein